MATDTTTTATTEEEDDIGELWSEGHGTSESDIRSIEEIINDYEGGQTSVFDDLSNAYNKAKSTASKISKFTDKVGNAADKVTDKVTDAATKAGKNVAETAVESALGVDIDTSSGSGLLKTAAGVALTYAGSKAFDYFTGKDDEAKAASGTENAQETISKPEKDGKPETESKPDSSSKSERDSMHVAADNNLAAQEQIVNRNRQSGKISKLLTYTDSQVEEMKNDSFSLSKLSNHKSFLSNSDNPVVKKFEELSSVSQYGELSAVNIISKGANYISKKLYPVNAYEGLDEKSSKNQSYVQDAFIDAEEQTVEQPAQPENTEEPSAGSVVKNILSGETDIKDVVADKAANIASQVAKLAEVYKEPEQKTDEYGFEDNFLP